MTDRLDFSFQVLQTTLRVIYGDMTRLDADVVVSTDDTYLSASSGVSKEICDLAGRDMLRGELRKFALPLTPGSVVVTSGGNLKAKYIFHAASLDINSRPNPQEVTARIVRQVMDIANVQGVESIVTPLLVKQGTTLADTPVIVSQLTGLPEAQVLGFILRSLARYLAMSRSYTSVRRITIAMYKEDAADHLTAEKQLFADLATVRNDVTDWIEKVSPINAWMIHVLPLLMTMSDDNDKPLRELLRAYLKGGQDVLSQLFGGPEVTDVAGSTDMESYENAPLTKEEYDELKHRLVSVLKELDDEIQTIEELKRVARRNLLNLQVEQAKTEPNTPVSILGQIEDTQNTLMKYEQQLKEPNEKRANIQQELSTLEVRWQVQQENNVGAVPVAQE